MACEPASDSGVSCKFVFFAIPITLNHSRQTQRRIGTGQSSIPTHSWTSFATVTPRFAATVFSLALSPAERWGCLLIEPPKWTALFLGTTHGGAFTYAPTAQGKYLRVNHAGQASKTADSKTQTSGCMYISEMLKWLNTL